MHCFKLWSQYCGKLHYKHFFPSLNGKFGGQTHCWTLLSHTKLNVHVWTVGVVGVDVVAQLITFNWQVLASVFHSNGALHAIHSPLTSYGADLGHSQFWVSLFQM